jgi:hypothetical protein
MVYTKKIIASQEGFAFVKVFIDKTDVRYKTSDTRL